MAGLRGPAGTPAQKMAGYKVGQLQNFTPEQMDLFKSMFSNVSPNSYTSKLAQGDQSIFNQIEAPALKQFQDLLGQTSTRFSNMGMGARQGSGFQNAIANQTSGFAQDLASRRQALQRQALMDLSGMSKDLLSQHPYKQFLIEPTKKKSFLQKLLGGGLGLLGGGAGALLGGPFGLAIGSQLGNLAGSAFNDQPYQTGDLSGIYGLPRSWRDKLGSAQIS